MVKGERTGESPAAPAETTGDAVGAAKGAPADEGQAAASDADPLAEAADYYRPFTSPSLYAPPLGPNESDDEPPVRAKRPRRALIIALVSVLVIGLGAVAAIAFARARSAARPAVISTSADLRPDQLLTGDCIDPLPDAGEVDTVTVVQCSQFHAGQVVGEVTLADGDYPGTEALEEQTGSECAEIAAPYVKKATSQLDGSKALLTYLFPSSESWAKGDRTGVCIVYSPVTPLAGSLLDD